MNLMYPHAIDRLRAAYCLLLAWREKEGISQKELAARAKLTEGTISEFMGIDYLEDVALGVIDKTIGKPKTLKSRDTALRVLIRGLRRSQKDIDAMLWLYYGERFKPVDRDLDIDFTLDKECPDIGPANQYADDTDLRQQVMDLLVDAVKVLIPEPIKNAQVQMIFDFHEIVGKESDETLRKLEEEPGQRLVVTRFPSYLTCPDHMFNYSRWRGSYMQLSEEGKQKHRAITRERRLRFLQHLKDYGERSIHPKVALENYLKLECKHSMFSHAERIEHIEHWIELLKDKDNEHYEIGLADEEPQLELAIKNTVGAFLSGLPGETPSQKEGQSTHYGPRYILWRDKESIFSFFVDFERNWAAIPEHWRNKENVIKWLREKVSEATKATS